MRGLPIRLTDGKEYWFSVMKLGPAGQFIRKKFRQYSDVISEITSTDIPKEMTPAEEKALSDRFDALEERRLAAFLEIAVASLSENYSPAEAKKIAENLITPDCMTTISRIIRSGQYPEGFTPPPSQVTRAA